MDNNKSVYDMAIEDCILAVKQNSSSATAYHSLGIAYLNRGCKNDDKNDNQLALDCFNKAINLDQNFATAYNNRGFAHRCIGDNYQAITDFDQAISQHQKSMSSCLNNVIESISLSVAYYNRGNAYKDKGEFEKAIADWKMALIIDPNNIDARINLGVRE